MGRKPANVFERVPSAGVAIALAVLIGTLAVHALPALPPRRLDAVLGLVAFACLLHPRLRLAGGLLLGFAWCALRADLAFDARLPRELEGRDFDVVGVVDDLPRRRADATRFALRVEHAELDGVEVSLPGSLRLSWYDAAPDGLDACSRWRLTLRLKRPRGLVNPGGFDSERQALERGIIGVGYVRDAADAVRLGEARFCIDRLRERIAQGIDERIADAHDAALLRAFTVGDARGLDAADWDVARANGISHLLSISGFHVGVAAAAGAWAVRLLGWLWPALGLRIALPLLQAPAAFVVAAAYGALAGGGLPTVRTVLMIGAVALARCGRRARSPVQALALALLAMLLFDPLATLAAGFWLSFVGVAFLMLSMTPGRGLIGRVRELGVGQLVMTASLLPLTVWFFGQASLLGALSNLVAVPLVGAVVVPLCLLGLLALLVAPALATAPFAAAGVVLHAQWWLLERLATWPGAHVYLPEAPVWAMLLATLGACWLFLPRGVPARALGLLLFVPLLWPPRAPPERGGFETVLVDVGQGLAVIVRTRDHALLFDAGARYPSDFDLGEVAVLPTLHALGVAALDTLIVSHGDNDHAGGAAAVAKAYPEASLLAGEPQRMPLPAAPCREGQAWRWDDVAFRMLGPAPALPGEPGRASGNARSCVLLVEGRAGRLLLTGDIDARVEATLAAKVGAGPPLVLVAPHHGSRTSSSAAFLAALRPAFALVSAAWRSRFGHPHPQVLQRYAQAGIALSNTADAGALSVTFPPDAPPQAPLRERERRRRHWRE